ncbi:iron-sulfur-dependent L-serine dehydratase beta subunit [Scopulibacillus darangshiensis]|uniref:L-serine deaminase n=1 Tax=Scopulibacillus darangshiensis TaxID=442528 RepID=A0A4R2P572_9BACL|nr:serine dehydratase beta chain [Scopulibacillus darangshiensis]TCP29827.1 iron-sulfur-dependent L-serine dehydratase beta subunit [Scopulibacillus darangshiensis]
MEFQSCFDIIGPIMIGPSSSHTAGAVSIGKFAYHLLGETLPNQATITLYDSFSQTYQGHGTDKALIGGLLGMGTDDTRIKQALNLAERYGVEYTFQLKESCPYFDHPNVAVISAKNSRQKVKVGGASLGGGLAKIFSINDYEVDIRVSTDDDLGGNLSSLIPRLSLKSRMEVLK